MREWWYMIMHFCKKITLSQLRQQKGSKINIKVARFSFKTPQTAKWQHSRCQHRTEICGSNHQVSHSPQRDHAQVKKITLLLASSPHIPIIPGIKLCYPNGTARWYSCLLAPTALSFWLQWPSSSRKIYTCVLSTLWLFVLAPSTLPLYLYHMHASW
jgi:hypothetical protein